MADLPAAFDLTGRVALVTGAGSASGIGFACAGLMAELGATVAVDTTDRIADRVRELEQRGLTASGHRADLTVDGQAESLVDEALTRHGRLDILANNAGMVSVTGGFESGVFAYLLLETWHAGLAWGNPRYGRSRPPVGVPHLPAGGRIVNVASVTEPASDGDAGRTGLCGGEGRHGRTDPLVGAFDLGPKSITANAVAPGMDPRPVRRPRTKPARWRPLPWAAALLRARWRLVVAWLSSPGRLLRHRPVCRRRRR